jgi:hypothetical protein
MTVTSHTPARLNDRTAKATSVDGNGGETAQEFSVSQPTALVIDPEFRALIPPLTDDELQQLVANLEADGCLDPLKVWRRDDGQPDVLLDGHNRYDICLPRGIPFHTEPVPGIRTREEAMIWILRHQFGRRNLTPYARTELAVKLTELIAAQSKRQQGTRTDIFPNLGRGLAPIQTDREVATLAAVSHGTVHKVRRFAQEADEATKDALRRGSRSIDAVHKTLPPRRPASSATAAAAPAVPSPTPVTPAPVERPPRLQLAQRMIDLAEAMVQTLAEWRRQYPHDAVVHAFGRMEKHLTEIKDYFGRKLQEMHASYATGDAPEGAARQTEDATVGGSGEDHPHELPGEGSDALNLAGAHGVTPASLEPGVSMSVPGAAEGTAPRPAGEAEAPAADVATTPPGDSPDDSPPAGTASHGTPAQDPPAAMRPRASQASSARRDGVRRLGPSAGAGAPTGGVGATAGDVVGGSPRANAKRRRELDTLNRRGLDVPSPRH